MPVVTVPFYDLTKEYQFLKKDITRAIQRVLATQRFVLGDELSQFEEAYAKYLGVQYSVGVGSGTDGLILSLMALGIQKGDEVMTQGNTFIATAYAISIVGAKPVLVDVDPKTHQMDPKKIESRITRRTKAIIPVHMFGSPSPITEIVKIARKHTLFVVEDACQAHGAEYKNQKLGTFGDMSVFSFYPSKTLGAYGDGGIICTNKKNLYKKLLLLRNYGERMKYEHTQFGTNTRLDEIQAAVLRVKLTHLDYFVSERNKIADFYRDNLDLPSPGILQSGKSGYHLYVITHNKRDKLKAFLIENHIHTHIHYPVPIHLQKVYDNLLKKEFSLPITETLAKTSLSLPIFYGISKKQREVVVRKVNSFS